MSSLSLGTSNAPTASTFSHLRASIPAFVALAFFALALMSPKVLSDADTWWHLAAGAWILAHGAAPHVDPFSLTMAGAPWVAHEWLSEALMALAFRIAGLNGVVILMGAAAAVAVAIVARRVAKDLDGPALLIVTALGLSLVLPSFYARPHVLALPVFALWSDQLLTARDRGRAPSVLLAALMALWANLHGGFVFGLALIAPFALEAVLAAEHRDRARIACQWAVFAASSVAAALLTPNGLDGLLFPLRLANMASLNAIGEWRPVSFDHFQYLELATFGLFALALTRPVTMPVIRTALLLGLLHLSLAHVRHQMLLGVLAPMLLAPPIARGLRLEPTPRLPRAAARPAFAAAAMAAFALIAFRTVDPIVATDRPSTPIAAIAATPAALREKPVLNEYVYGGYLIWAGVRPFIDSRADMYGDRFIDFYRRVADADSGALDEALTKNAIAWTIFPPDSPVVAVLDRRLGWRRLYAGPFAIVHVRADALEGRTFK